MKIIRTWRDNGEREEITEEELRSKLEGNFRDVDLAIESMKDGCPARTNFATYTIEDDEATGITERTVECRTCGYCTDLSILSETNPKHCPKCGEALYLAGTEIRWDPDN